MRIFVSPSEMAMVLHQTKFKKLLDHEEIQSGIRRLARRINKDYKGKDPLFIVVLNGAFMFASDLLKEVSSANARVSFIKLSSYRATESTGNVKQLIGLNENIFNQDIILVEDIIDTGTTIRQLLMEMEKLGVASVKLATLLAKKKEVPSEFPIDYVGFEIEDEFVVGYGMDYDGIGRNIKHIYVQHGPIKAKD